MTIRWILRVAAALLVLVAPARMASADEVTDWNQMLFRAALVANSSPLVMTRNSAIVQAAVYDAVNGIERRYTPIHVPATGPAGASLRAAAMQAAYVALGKLYGATPSLQLLFEARRNASLADILARENSAAVAAGVAWGDSVGNQIFAWRLTDGIALLPSPWLGNSDLGQWHQTPNAPLPGTSTPGAGYPQFVGMTPWAIVSPAQFQAPKPPELTSARYARDFNEVKMMGSQTSATRSADQTIFALVWASGTASYLWNNAAIQLLDGRGRDDDNESEEHSRDGRRGLLEHARILGAMDVALADAAIACWDTKYTYNLWRPILGIRDLRDDGNALTSGDAGWTPLLSTPAHPSYTSGHSCVSAAAAGILAHEFGEHTRFTIESDQMPGVVRSFNTFNAALEEVKDARVFAGIHWRFDCERGQEIGAAVASYVLENSFKRAR
jgi:PAP2 superfamily protein